MVENLLSVGIFKNPYMNARAPETSVLKQMVAWKVIQLVLHAKYDICAT